MEYQSIDLETPSLAPGVTVPPPQFNETTPNSSLSEELTSPPAPPNQRYLSHESNKFCHVQFLQLYQKWTVQCTKRIL